MDEVRLGDVIAKAARLLWTFEKATLDDHLLNYGAAPLEYSYLQYMSLCQVQLVVFSASVHGLAECRTL
jgi:hypothetical protein